MARKSSISTYSGEVSPPPQIQNARIFLFGRVCWSWYLQYFCIFECYCKNISLWEGVLVLISTIFLYIWMLLQEYFTLGGCAGLDIYNIFVYLNVIARNFNLGGCAGLRLHLHYSCPHIYDNVRFQEYTLGGCAGLKITISLYICICVLQE